MILRMLLLSLWFWQVNIPDVAYVAVFLFFVFTAFDDFYVFIAFGVFLLVLFWYVCWFFSHCWFCVCYWFFLLLVLLYVGGQVLIMQLVFCSIFSVFFDFGLFLLKCFYNVCLFLWVCLFFCVCHFCICCWFCFVVVGGCSYYFDAYFF